MTRSRTRNEEERDAFNNDNPDPRMRPVYSALRHKLRNLSALDDPSLSMLVIDDMIYHRFLFKEKHPDALWYLMKQVHSYWLRSLGGEMPVPHGEALQLSFLGQSEKGLLENLNEEVSGKVKIEFLDDKELKKAVRVAVHQHYLVDTFQLNCGCGKEFDLMEQWANHVRSVIWRVIRESLDSSGDSGEPQEASGEADSTYRGESTETA